MKAPAADTAIPSLKGQGNCCDSVRPDHIGLVPDGNRRYARKVGLSVGAAYFAAVDKALETIDWCGRSGASHVSAFGVSQENIAARPDEEIAWLHHALLRFCRAVSERSDVHLHVFGEPAGLAPSVPGRSDFIKLADRGPASTDRLVVHVGVNYSGQAELTAVLGAVQRHGAATIAASPYAFTLSAGIPPVDLVIRTGGQQRLSGFLPFQTAYAELWFTSTLWPEFRHEEFLGALEWYAHQERRFGE
jgi:undecaprenyl diphosphate synthase